MSGQEERIEGAEFGDDAKNFEICPFCRKRKEGPLTREHVPPKCIFPKDKRSELITVPACSSCNGASSKDDEYLRLVLSAMIEGPDAEELSEDALRGIGRQQSAGFRKEVVRALRYLPRETPLGLYLGREWGIQIDCNRIKKSILKIGYGLYYKHWGKPVPEDYEVYVDMSLKWKGELISREGIFREMLPVFMRRNVYCGGEDCFMYKFVDCNDNKNIAAFLVSIHKKIHSFLYIVPKEKVISRAIMRRKRLWYP